MRKRKRKGNFLQAYLGLLVTSNTLEDLQARIFNFDVQRLKHILFATFHTPPCTRKCLHSCQTVMKHSAYLFPFDVKNYIHPLNISSYLFHLNRCVRKSKLIDYTPFSFKEWKVCKYKTVIRQIRLEVTNALIFKYAFLLSDTLRKHQNVKSTSCLFIVDHSSVMSWKGDEH